MTYGQNNSLQQLQIRETLVAGGVEGLLRVWQAPANLFGKFCVGAERWHETLRQTQSPANFADILRARTFI